MCVLCVCVFSILTITIFYFYYLSDFSLFLFFFSLLSFLIQVYQCTNMVLPIAILLVGLPTVDFSVYLALAIWRVKWTFTTHCARRKLVRFDALFDFWRNVFLLEISLFHFFLYVYSFSIRSMFSLQAARLVIVRRTMPGLQILAIL